MSRLRKFLFIVALVVSVAILGAIGRHYQLRWAVNRVRAELKAKGVPFELPPLSEPPKDTDGSAALLQALDSAPYKFGIYTNLPPAMRMAAPGRAIIGFKQPDIHNEDASNSWEQAKETLALFRPSEDLLCQLLERPEVNFQISYAKGFSDTNFFKQLHLTEMKTAAQFLSAAAVIHLRDGQGADAVREARTSLAVASAIKSQRTGVSELVRYALIQITQTATWAILQSDAVKEVDLAALQRDWQNLELMRGYRDAMDVEMIVQDQDTARWLNSDAEMSTLFDLYPSEDSDAPLSGVKRSWNVFMWRHWWSYQDELRWLRGCDVMRDAANEALTNRALGPIYARQEDRLYVLGFGAISNGLDSVLSGNINFHSMLSEAVNSLGPCFKKAEALEALRQMAIAAIALKRYHLAHHEYPERLDAMAPEYFEAVPFDPADGQPLRYRRNPDGSFLLYSIGDNGKDDGGDPVSAKESDSFSWMRGRDWVWPTPATPEEIQAWEKSHSYKQALKARAQ